MKKLLRVLLALAACSAALCLTAAAVEASAIAPTRVWGQVSPWEGEGIFLKNDSKDDPMNEVVVHAGDAPAVDAETGLPLDLEAVKEGDTLYAWIGPAATMSLPPQVRAEAIVGNVPEGRDAPEYYVIDGTRAADGSKSVFPTLGGGTLAVDDKTSYTPWMTRQIVRMEDLTPGTQVLAWKSGDAAEKVLVFPYAYRGYVTCDAMPHGDLLLSMNGTQIPSIPYKRTEDGVVLAPVRLLAEAAGYSVSWDKNRGAVVYDENIDLVFYAVPGEQVIFQDGGEVGISAPCVLEKGVTYLPVEDLCYWLNLYFAA